MGLSVGQKAARRATAANAPEPPSTWGEGRGEGKPDSGNTGEASYSHGPENLGLARGPVGQRVGRARGGTRLAAVFALALLPGIAALASTPLTWGKYTHRLSTGLFETHDMVAPVGLTDVIEVSCGLQHAAFLTADGQVRVVGEWTWNQTNVPVSVSNVAQIAAGDFHTLARLRDGTVRAWGATFNNQCQVPASATNSAFVAAGGFHSLSLSASGLITGWGDNRNGQSVPPAGLTNVVALAAGEFHTLALRGDGRVVAWGSNTGGQTNVPANLSNVVAIAAGGGFSLALRSDGTLVGWGTNNGGQLNFPPGLNGIARIAAGERHVAVLRTNGQVLAWGNNTGGQTTVPAAAAGSSAIGAGGLHSAAIVGGVAPRFLDTPVSLHLLPGESGALAGSAVGSQPLSYQWRLEGTNLPGATQARLTLTNAGARHAGTYTLVASNPWGAATANATVFVAGTPPAILEAPVDLSGVVGTAVALEVVGTGTPPLRYQWTYNGSDLAGATSSRLLLPSLTYGQAGTYGVRVGNDYGSVTSAPVSLVVEAVGSPPQITGQPTNTSVIIAEPVTLTAQSLGSSPLAWQWYHNGLAKPGATRRQYRLDAVAAGDAGGYHVRVTNHYGAHTSQVAVLTTVGLPPTVTTQPQSLSTAVGSKVTLVVVATGTLPLLYQWQRHGTSLPGATASTLTLANAQTHHSGPYQVLVRNDYGAVTSDVATVLIEQPNPPVIITQPVGQTNYVGDCFSIGVVAGGEAPLSYQWRQNGFEVPGATSSSMTFCPARTNQSGGYQVRVTNRWGAAQSVVASILVTYPPVAPEIVTQPGYATNLLGATAVISPDVTGTAPLSYQWRKDDVPLVNGARISGANAARLQVANFGPADIGFYQLRVTNAAGWVASEASYQALAPTNGSQGMLLVDDNTTQGSWKGVYGSAGYVVIGNRTNLPPGVSMITGNTTNGLWALNTSVPQALSKATSDNPNERIAANWIHPTTFWVDLVLDRPYELAVYCLDWNNVGARQRIEILPAATGTPLASGVVSNFAQGKYLRFQVAGAVRVKVTSVSLAGAMISGLFLDGIGAPIITSQPVSQTHAVGGTAEFNVGGSGAAPLSYHWRHNGAVVAGATTARLVLPNLTPAQAGAYQAVLSNSLGSVTSQVATLTVEAFPPTITQQPQSATAVRDSTLTVSAEVSGTAPIALAWFKDGVEIPGANEVSLELADVELADAGDYWLVASNAYGSVTSAVAHIEVVVAAAILVGPQSVTVETGGPIVLHAQVEGTAPMSLTWLHDGEVMPGATEDTLVIAGAALADAGAYVLVVSNAWGYATSAPAVVTVNLAPNVPPVAVDDTLVLPGSGPRIIAVAELLANDFDPEGGTVSLRSVTPLGQRGGTVEWSDETITFTPAAPEHLWDSFGYEIGDDRGDTASATVWLRFEAESNGSIAEISGVVMGDDGLELTVTFVGLPHTTYRVEAGESASGPWTVVATVTADGEGVFRYTDTSVGSRASRYYRTVGP